MAPHMIHLQRSTRSSITTLRSLHHSTMIRRKLSSGVLRASKSSGSLRSTAIAHAHAAPVAHTQTAGLASATLLSSQRNWGKETVVTLKSELKKRGLSQAGTK